MTRKLKVALWRSGAEPAEYPLRVEKSADIETGVREALAQFAMIMPEHVIGENGVSLTIEALEVGDS